MRLREGLLRPLLRRLRRLLLFPSAFSCFAARFSAFLGAFACLSAFSAFFAAFSCFAVPATAVRIPALSSSSSRWAYQMSIVRICANAAIASR